jgi:hypothetical protein
LELVTANHLDEFGVDVSLTVAKPAHCIFISFLLDFVETRKDTETLTANSAAVLRNNPHISLSTTLSAN